MVVKVIYPFPPTTKNNMEPEHNGFQKTVLFQGLVFRFHVKCLGCSGWKSFTYKGQLCVCNLYFCSCILVGIFSLFSLTFGMGVKLFLCSREICSNLTCSYFSNGLVQPPANGLFDQKSPWNRHGFGNHSLTKIPKVGSTSYSYWLTMNNHEK